MNGMSPSLLEPLTKSAIERLWTCYEPLLSITNLYFLQNEILIFFFYLEADVSRQKRKKVIDKMAAVFILQGYLDSIS